MDNAKVNDGCKSIIDREMYLQSATNNLMEERTRLVEIQLPRPKKGGVEHIIGYCVCEI